jgi:non-heme chloroperoxidase
MQFGPGWSGVVAALIFALMSPLRAAERQMIETAPGIHIRVLDAGAKDAAITLVLIPGWRFTADIWHEQIETFSSRYRVIALDPRSQGDSTKALEGNTPEDRAVDLHTILEQLHAGPTVLVGWSQGAHDVAAYIGEFGTNNLLGLVFVDTAPAQGWEKAIAAPGAAQVLQRVSLYARGSRDATAGMVRSVFRTQRPKPEVERLIADAMKTPPTIAASMLVADLFGPDRMSPLSKADVPALLIAADSSPQAPELAALARVLPKALPVKSIAGTGHAVFVDQPKEFDALLSTFLVSLQKVRHP